MAERCDVMLMQNWQHVATTFSALNGLPEQQHSTDIMRVREWLLCGWGRHYRQTILLSSFAFPELLALSHQHCANHAGSYRVKVGPSGWSAGG